MRISGRGRCYIMERSDVFDHATSFQPLLSFPGVFQVIPKGELNNLKRVTCSLETTWGTQWFQSFQWLWPVEWGNSPSLIFCASLQNVSVFSLASWFLLMPTRGSHSVSLLPLRSMIWFNFFDPNRNACRSLFSGIFHVFLMRMECAGWIFDSIKGPTIFLVIDWRLLLRMA